MELFIIVVLAFLLVIFFIANTLARSDLRRLKYICLTNAKVKFFTNYQGGFLIKVFGSEGVWEGGIDKVYHTFSSPDAYQRRVKLNAPKPEELVKAEDETDDEYKPGQWKERSTDGTE